MFSFFLRKRRPHRQQENRGSGSDKSVSSPTARQEQPVELNAERWAELNGNARSELEGRSKVGLDENARSELDGRSEVELKAKKGGLTVE